MEIITGEVKVINNDAQDRLLKSATNYAANELKFRIDTFVSLHIQPKPWWLPSFIWERILKRLLILSQFQK